MRKQVKLKLFAAVSLGFVLALGVMSAGHAGQNPTVYNNLMRSRDALLNQRAYLQKALDGLSSQLNDLNDKIGRLRDYLDQNDQALRDVDRALRQAGY
ncbi:MAG: hypothetical protein K2Y22_13390 [Candidatus Obscuribacterales bacterium]|nr:hypothetical protein [Candidatus Obscuribacterales bacterium]